MRLVRRCGTGVALLAVWLLLGPPLKNAAPDPDAPLADWKLYGRFATEAECASGLDLMRRMAGDGKYGWERRYWDELARCTDERVD